MQESAIKDLESKGNDAEIRKSRISRIAVEGYDTSLPKGDVEEALREHLASCGDIIHVHVPIDVKSGILCRYALVYVNEEDEEKVLRLNGSDMGGVILQINPYPFHQNHLEEDYLAPMKEVLFYKPQHTMMVTGFDTSLPLNVIETELKKYFSAAGTFVIMSTARVYVWGQEGVDKALERSGRSVGGFNFVVTRVVPLPKKVAKTGYMHPHNFTLFTKEQLEDPNLYVAYDDTKTADGNQQNKKKSKTRARNQKKKQKKKKKKSEGNQKMKGVEISF